jgi:Domain of unknown function (DUF5655)
MIRRQPPAVPHPGAMPPLTQRVSSNGTPLDGYRRPMDGRTWTVEDHLAGKPESVVALYDGFIALIEACGPFSYRVTKTAITLKGSRRGFAGAKPTKRSLDGYLDLRGELKDPRIRRASPYTKRLFVHQFRLTSLDQLDSEFASWIREAYAVGAGAHLHD